MNGTLHNVDGRSVLRFERRLEHSPERVWRALTEPAELVHWFPAAMDVDGSTGHIRFTFPDRGIESPGGAMIDSDPPRLLAFSWGDSLLRFELLPEQRGCLLVFTHTFGDRADAPKFAAGWHVCLEALDAVVGGAPQPAPESTPTPRWQEMHERYCAEFDAPAELESVPGEMPLRDLYARMLAAWNSRDADGMAACFTPDGASVGFDGSQMEGTAEIPATLREIFANHQTAAYVARVRHARMLGPGVGLLRAVVGMVPPGASDLIPAVNALQTVVATERDGVWRIALLQNTPAAFHGRPDLSDALTAELRALL